MRIRKTRGHLVRVPAVAALVVVVAAASPAGAQEASGFRFYSSSFSTGYDTGISTAEEDFVADTLFQIVPGALVWGTTSPRSDLQLIYEPEIEIYREQTELNALNHAAAAAFRHSFSRDFSLNLGSTFLRTNDRTLQTNSLTLAPRGEFTEGRAYGSVRWDVGDRTSLDFGANALYTETPTLLLAEEGGTVNDLTGSFNASLSQSVGRRHSLFGSYAHLRSTLLNPEDFPTTDPVRIRKSHSVSGGYNFRSSGGLQLAASVGLIYIPDENLGSSRTYSWSARIDKDWESLSIGGGYSRSLAALLYLDQEAPADQISDPLLSNNVTDSGSFRISGQFSRRVAIDGRLIASRTEVTASEDPLDVASASVTFTVRAANRLAPFGNASYWRQTATEILPAISRTRVTGGIRVFLGTVPSASNFSSAEPARAYLPVSTGR